tara:strand:+ start:1342 stop:1581 length:240 start_codon:yes stop_codon:yes gene_type:complete
MEQLKEINGFYGTRKIECTILAYFDTSGCWYCLKGQRRISFTYDDVKEGVNIGDIKNQDYSNADSSINTLRQLEIAVSS